MTVRHNIVVFTGAGISAESGISTFRDKEGLWSKYDSMRLASIDGFREDPEAVLEFYNARRMQLYNVSPNHAPYALAELEKLHNVTVITQNVDDLHERAGSSKVIHDHEVIHQRLKLYRFPFLGYLPERNAFFICKLLHSPS